LPRGTTTNASRHLSRPSGIVAWTPGEWAASARATTSLPTPTSEFQKRPTKASTLSLLNRPSRVSLTLFNRAPHPELLELSCRKTSPFTIRSRIRRAWMQDLGDPQLALAKHKFSSTKGEVANPNEPLGFEYSDCLAQVLVARGK